MAEKILVYGTPTCPYCQQVKSYLKEKNITFEDFDVSQDQEKLAEMQDKSGQMGVPVIDIDGKIIKGFDREELNQALGIS